MEHHPDRKAGKLNKIIILLTLIYSTSLLAEDFQYFSDSIDYWSEGEIEKAATPSKEPLPKAQGFNWKKYKDPKNKEFFKEGNYVPPEPFMELVRDPSDSNIKNWFQYIEIKNKLAMRLQKRLRDYTDRNSVKLDSEEKESLSKVVANIRPGHSNAKRYRFRLYVDSKCPHCKNMLKTAQQLQSDGYFIEVKQVDKDFAALKGLPIVVKPASKDELKKHKINSVPILLVGDMQKKAVFRVSGYRSKAEIINMLKR